MNTHVNIVSLGYSVVRRVNVYDAYWIRLACLVNITMNIIYRTDKIA